LPPLSGCDLNAVDNYGDCALKKAAFSGHADFVKALLEAGANPNVCDGFMKSPL
jgi:ankyrin repeat protein